MSDHPSEHPSDTDVDKLRQLVEEMAITITRLSDDMFTKNVVNSVFDSKSVEDTIEDLRALNQGERQKWMFNVKSPDPTMEVVHRSKDQHPEASNPEQSSSQTA